MKAIGIHALSLYVLLGGLQLYALARQWQEGFRPFVNPPGRVALSWDMFAVAIERCSIEWDPPVPRPDGQPPLRTMAELATPIEWDPVYNRREDYLAAGAQSCNPGASGGKFRVHCFRPHFEETYDERDCGR